MISVVIPLFNKESTIDRTIRSVLNQTFQDFEVIIVNDGSTDESLKRVEQFVDERIIVYVQENHGVSVARNNGVNWAKNELIAFIDGDDEWEKDYLSTMVTAIRENEHAGMYCSAGVVKNADGSCSKRIDKKQEGKIQKVEFFKNPHVYLHTSATIVRRSVFQQAGGFPPGMKRNQDFALFFSVALLTEVVYVGFPLSIYNGGVIGQTTSVDTSKNLQVLKHVADRYNHVFRHWLDSQYRKRYFLEFLKYELRNEFVVQLRKQDNESVDFLLKNLDPGVIRKFSKWEVALYKNRSASKIAIYYIIFTKLLWRLNGYPRVKKNQK